MPTCEMCGKEESDLTPVRVSQAELEVCEDCSTIGTRLESDTDDDESTDTKYSTESDDSPSDSTDSADSPDNGRGPDSEMVTPLVPDYADRIRDGRNQSGLTIEELADQIDEKASYIQNIERGDAKPDTTTQMQLEQFLNIDLTLSDENQWLSSDSYNQQYDTQ